MNDKDVELFFRCAVLYARAWQDILEEEETSSTLIVPTLLNVPRKRNDGK